MHKRKSIAAIGVIAVLFAGGLDAGEYVQVAQQTATTAALHKEISRKNAQIHALNKQVDSIQTQLVNEQKTNAANIKNLQNSINKINSQLPF